MINNLGWMKELLFEGGKEGQQERTDWLASFTKSGCSICRGEGERSDSGFDDSGAWG
jgi:hypothetical protein